MEDEDMKPENAGYSYDGKDSVKEESTVPAWMVPARRSDNIGALAWRFIGADGALPDFTAAGPLSDALQEEDPEAAHQFRRRVCAMIEDLHRAGDRRQAIRNWMKGCQRKTTGSVSYLLYDFNSITGILCEAVTRATAPAAPMTEESTTVKIVSLEIGYRNVGDIVNLPDGRRGTVISETSDEGITRVMISD